MFPHIDQIIRLNGFPIFVSPFIRISTKKPRNIDHVVHLHFATTNFTVEIRYKVRLVSTRLGLHELFPLIYVYRWLVVSPTGQEAFNKIFHCTTTSNSSFPRCVQIHPTTRKELSKRRDSFQPT